MKPECHFYIDDSGARDPDRNRTVNSTEPDWFALGGLLIDESKAEAAKTEILNFRERWPELEGEPFRSYDIRNKTDRFRWLASAPPERYRAFMEELTALMVSLPIHVLACVVDRPGYNKRYMAEYGQRRWRLCRTAFTIVVERAAKVALHRGARLRVYAEQSDKHTEAHFREYFDSMRKTGLPFNAANSEKYRPLTQEQLHATLFEFRIKTKKSVLMQFADLVLWPMCRGGYDKTHRAYKALVDGGKLIEVQCTADNGLLGTKYSCFDEGPETQKPA
jgi:hypothetical protein